MQLWVKHIVMWWKVDSNMALLITGMHRSGTSLVAGIANKLGYNLGRRDDNNENRSFQHLNEIASAHGVHR